LDQRALATGMLLNPPPPVTATVPSSPPPPDIPRTTVRLSPAATGDAGTPRGSFGSVGEGTSTSAATADRGTLKGNFGRVGGVEFGKARPGPFEGTSTA